MVIWLILEAVGCRLNTFEFFKTLLGLVKSVRLGCGKFCGTSLRFPFVVAMDAYDAVEPVADINLEQEATVILGRRSEDLAPVEECAE